MSTGEWEGDTAGRARLGRVLRGKYRLDRILGEGGMAVVYEATHRNRARFAIKVLHPELSRDAQTRSRFLSEGYAANSVKHPGAVFVVDDDVAEDGSAFLVMELLEGVSCSELGPHAPLDVACAILLQLLDVLATAHDRGIIHRDIKPANLFLTRAGQVKVLDFGIARVREAAMTANVTRSGVTLGTPAFMSPEQALGDARRLDGRTDLWSTGATFFWLVSGQFVHAGAGSAMGLLVAAATTPARSLAAVAPGLPPAVAAVIDRAIAFRTDDRWPTARGMRDALAAAFHAHFGPAAPEGVVATAVRSRIGTGATIVDVSPPGRPWPVDRGPPNAVAATAGDAAPGRSDAGPARSNRADANENAGPVARSSVFFVRPGRARRNLPRLVGGAIALAAALAAGVWAVHALRHRPAPRPAAQPTASAGAPPAASTASPSAVDYVVGRRTWRRVVSVPEPTAAAVQGAIERAGSGAIVVLPAGRIAIDQPLVVHGDDVLLVGAGAGSLEPGSTADASATVLLATPSDGSRRRPLLRVVGGHRVEVSGIRLEGIASDDSKDVDAGVEVEDAEDFRVDHCYFTHLTFGGVRVSGVSRGLVDHCTFYAEYKASATVDGYGVVVYGTNALGGVPLGTPAPDGVPPATVVEDSRFALCRHAIASTGGARYVFRHNTMSELVSYAVTADHAEHGVSVGAEWIDVSENTIEQTEHRAPYHDGWAVRVRAGQAAIWGNTFRGYRTGVVLSQPTSQACGPVYVWGNLLDPPSATMVVAERAANGASPSFTSAPPPGYRAPAYPHPLAAAGCDGKPSTRAGAARVCGD
jgi:serine/threonine-protein kinase